MADLSAAEVIELLDLKPHPEGGHFRETFRDGLKISNTRAASSAIYFLLARGQRSCWHKIDAVEIWHYHAGAPLELQVALHDTGPTTRLTLGPDLMRGARPQVIVPAQAWQSAHSLGDWTRDVNSLVIMHLDHLANGPRGIYRGLDALKGVCDLVVEHVRIFRRRRDVGMIERTLYQFQIAGLA